MQVKFILRRATVIEKNMEPVEDLMSSFDQENTKKIHNIKL
jgi:hypothetical protein